MTKQRRISLNTQNQYSPFSIFGESLFDVLNQTVSEFPFYNIINIDDSHTVIELALAGYKHEDIEITVNKNVITVKSDGGTATESRGVACSHKGISNKAFTRQFLMGEFAEFDKALLDNGILSLYLVRVVPEEAKPKKIEIGKPKESLLLG